MNNSIEAVLKDLAAEVANRPRRIMAAQGAMFLSQKSSTDEYHDFRVPALLQKLAAGEMGSLGPDEKQIVDNALTIASRRFEDLEGMDWGNAVYGTITDETKDHYNKAVELLIKRYDPQVRAGSFLLRALTSLQIILGTTSMIATYAEPLRKLVTHVIIDEAGKVSTLDAACFLMTWPGTRSLTLIGDVLQLQNFLPSGFPPQHKKWGFDSALVKAELHPHAFKTRLTQVFRSHPAIVDVLAQFVYGDLHTAVRAEDRPLMKATGLLKKDHDYPILFVDCDGQHSRNFVNSYTNKEQTDVACNIAEQLDKATPHADVRFYSIYGGARDELNEQFKARGLRYTAVNVDASQGN